MTGDARASRVGALVGTERELAADSRVDASHTRIRAANESATTKISVPAPRDLAAWVGEMQEEATAWGRAYAASCRGILERRDAIDAHVSQRLTELEAEGERRQMLSLADVADAVRVKMASGAIDDLTPREARTAGRMSREWPALALSKLLRARPEAMRPFLESYLREWDGERLTQDGRPLANWVRAVPQTALPGWIAIADLIADDAPARIASAFAPATLETLCRAIQAEARWLVSWDLPARIIAEWLSLHARRGEEPSRLLEQLLEVPVAFSALLPPDGAGVCRWGGKSTKAPARRPMGASARVVGLFLRGFAGSKDETFEQFSTDLLASVVGDPRLPRETADWSAIRREDRVAYDWFLEGLNRADIELFFKHAMTDAARMNFWLRYIKSIRRAMCVLTKVKYRTLAASLEQVGEVSAMARVRKFKSESEYVSAFCIYFDKYVVVEFSETGNAAYIYERESFESDLGEKIRRNELVSRDDLKLRRHAKKITHHAGWAARARDDLLRIGIS